MLRQSILFFSSFFRRFETKVGNKRLFLFPVTVVALFTCTLLVPPCVCLCPSMGCYLDPTLFFCSLLFSTLRVLCYVLSSSLFFVRLFTFYFVFPIVISSFLLFPQGCVLRWHRSFLWLHSLFANHLRFVLALLSSSSSTFSSFSTASSSSSSSSTFYCSASSTSSSSSSS